jgi:hypothetical protein
MRQQITRIARVKTKEKLTRQKRKTNPQKRCSARREIFYHLKMVVDKFDVNGVFTLLRLTLAVVKFRTNRPCRLDGKIESNLKLIRQLVIAVV